MSENITIPPTQYAHYPALMPPAELAAMQRYARRDPDGFWLQQAKRVHWHRKPKHGFTGSFTGDVSISWFEDGLINASVCCIDKHLTDKADQVALISHREGRAEAEKLHMPCCMNGFAVCLTRWCIWGWKKDTVLPFACP